MAGSQSNGVSLPTLILTGGPLDGTEFPLRMTTREVSIGSSGGNDVQVSLGNVDPIHAMLTFGSSGLTIADVGSGTGTFVNGEKVEGEVVLQDGDRICLGPPGAKESAKLLVRLPGAVAGVPAAGPAPPADAGTPSFIDTDSEPGPVLLEGDAAPAVTLSEEAPWPPPATPPPPSPPPVPEPPVAPAPPPAPEPPPPAPPPARPSPPRPPVAEPLTAPPPEELPPAEIPQLFEDAAPAPPPPPRRPRPPAGGRGRAARRARRSSPKVLPVVGGLLVLLAIGAAGWWFFLRPSSSPGGGTAAARPAPPTGGQPAPPSQAAPGATDAGAAASTGTRLQPDVALPGQSVQVVGALPSGPVTVTVAGETAQVEESTPEAIRFVVPNLSLPPGQTVQVVVQAAARSLPPLDLVLGRLPLILKLEPPMGTVGDRVVISGRGFDQMPRGNTVTFGEAPALVLKASPTELTVAVPAPRTIGMPEVPVVVAAGGRTSARDRQFKLQRPSAASFVPRFFPAPVSEYPREDYAFVSTELGPVLLLGGPAGGESTTARAAALAGRLNELVGRATSRRVDVELRGNGVAVVGETGSLVAAAPADVAAYEKGWEPGARRGPRLSTATLTRHWAAILEDYFALFLYRERPLEVASFSPRGQVFIDIYAEAVRRGSGRGVSAGIVLPTSDAMAQALRLAALVPSGGSPREEIAVVGRWQGTIEDPDTGSRRFEVRFTSEGKGLDGTLKTWRGSLELGSPVRDVSFRRGTLRFTADLQGTAHQFEGTLHNTTITGTASRQGRSPASFTLEFAE